MNLLQIGNRIVNLDLVTDINLDAPESDDGVNFHFGEAYRLRFEGDEAGAIRDHISRLRAARQCEVASWAPQKKAAKK